MPHEITDDCYVDHCHYHNEDEPASGAYRVCGECLHAYMTDHDLMNSYNEALPQSQVTVEQIAFCPLCAHDF